MALTKLQALVMRAVRRDRGKRMLHQAAQNLKRFKKGSETRKRKFASYLSWAKGTKDFSPVYMGARVRNEYRARGWGKMGKWN